MSLEQYAIDPVAIETGVAQIKKRYRKLDIFAICTATIFFASLVALYLQQDFVYGFFGLTTEVKQLHIPISADSNLASLKNDPDYFINLLKWFGWLVLKIFVSFIGSFFILRFLKRFHFFAQRFKSFVLKFVGWLIAFILVWSGLTYIQYDGKNEQHDAYAKTIYYDQNIQQSEIAQYLSTSNLSPTVQAYLLAQTALLHQPVDKDAAIPYVLTLVKAEKNDPYFIEYGFKPEQLWTMQYQLYAKALTPLAQSVEKQAVQAEQLNTIIKILILVFSIGSAVLTVFLLLLSRNLKHRALRIEQRVV